MMADAELRAAEKLMRAAEIEASIAEASQAKLREAVTKVTALFITVTAAFDLHEKSNLSASDSLLGCRCLCNPLSVVQQRSLHLSHLSLHIFSSLISLW